tara:strand:+ start:7617 stop:7841 length:225 start_codon:yes stop_codon:yes gene_type:complete
MHPLIDDISSLSESELIEKVADLSKKYWQTTNPDLRTQVGTIIEMYKIELRVRQEKEKNKEKDDNDLDNLIKIS